MSKVCNFNDDDHQRDQTLFAYAATLKTPLRDSFGRIAKKLRISVTDRCNFRCHFCMPVKPIWLPKQEILCYEEIVRISKILADMGVTKIRLSGGEPLVRKDVDTLVEKLKGINKIETISMTTNGFYLAEMAERLKKAGLQSVTVSLHSLKPDRFEEIVGKREVFERMMEGIRQAESVGLNPIKVNVVITRGCNDDEILDFAYLARRTGWSVRFIEYMPFDGQKMWDVNLLVSGEEIVQTIEKQYPLTLLPKEQGSTAKIYRFSDESKGTVGIITSMTEPFCSDCDRIRLTADGKLVPCLFSKEEYDLKSLLRNGATDQELSQFIRSSFWKKFAGVKSLLQNEYSLTHVRPMHTIGG